MGKKVALFIFIILIVVLLGGGTYYYLTHGNLFEKTVTCTKETTEDGMKTSETLVVTYNNKTILKTRSTTITDTTSEYIDMQYNFGKSLAEGLNKLNGITASYEKNGNSQLKFIMDIDFETIDQKQLKETFGELYDEKEAKKYSSGQMSFEKYKSENLEGYTCK